MADQVSKSLTTVAWVLISIIGLVIVGGALFGLLTFFAIPLISVWVKLLVAIGLIGGSLLLIVVIRDRIKEHKADKYKDVDV